MKTKVKKNTFTKDECFEQMKTSLQQKRCEQGNELIQGYLLMQKGRFSIPNAVDLKVLIMNELHKNPYSIHSRYQKMVTRERKCHCCRRMKIDIVEYTERGFECQQVKFDYQHPACHATTISNSSIEMGGYFNGFYCKFSQDKETT